MRKEIKEFPNYYATKEGKIISKRTGKELSKWIDNVGYYQCLLYKNGKRLHKRIHNLIAQTFLEEAKEKPEVNHIDGNKLNNKIENLEFVSGQYNTLHGYNEGLYKTNKRNIRVRVYLKQGDSKGDYIGEFNSIRSLSEKLKLNRKTVSNIIFNEKTNCTLYIFEPIIEEEFFFIEVYSREGKFIGSYPSVIQTSEATRLPRETISNILKKKSKNKTKYIFIKRYKNAESTSSETIESIV